MPLTKSGMKVKAAMKEEYGPEKGEGVFYASINKGNPGSEKWHEKNKVRRIGAKASQRKPQGARTPNRVSGLRRSG